MRLPVLLLFIAFASACDKPDAPDCLKQAGEVGVEQRNLGAAIREVDLDDLVNLTVFNTTEASDYVVVKGPRNLLQGVETRLDGATLFIANTNRCNWVRDLGIRLEVELHTSALERIAYRGQGKVLFADTLHRPHFGFEGRNGAGDIHLRVVTDSLSVVVHTGYSNVLLEGSSTSANYFNQGWGVFNASRMSGFAVSCNNSSFSDMYVRSIDYLYAFVGGSGDVVYYGAPNQIDLGRDGTGMLIAAED